MDPSKNPPDKETDTGSLEQGDSLEGPPETTAAENKSDANVTDATNGVHAEQHAAPAAPEKTSFIKQLWHRFNIYLLLFVLVVLIAIAVTAALVIKDRSTKQTQETITSQGLSKDELEQLADSTTIGDSKQVLNIASNAIFGGTVLIRSNLEVAGALNVGSSMSIPGLTVTGNAQVAQLAADSLALSGAASVQGALSVRGGMNVSGNSTFAALSASQLTTGSLQLTGELNISSHINTSGPIPGLVRGNALGGGGTASISGSDTAGSIVINTGSSPPAGCFATLTFGRAFSSAPHVVVTPIGSSAGTLDWYVNRSSRDFSICTASSAAAGETLGFDYIVIH